MLLIKQQKRKTKVDMEKIIKSKEDAVNYIISDGCDTNKISDGYHTFEELYEHRIHLFIALCKIIDSEWGLGPNCPWKTKKYSDGSLIEGGWFLLGTGIAKGKQITYHLPISKWDDCSFVREFDKAPEFDGHTSDHVLQRLKELK